MALCARVHWGVPAPADLARHSSCVGVGSNPRGARGGCLREASCAFVSGSRAKGAALSSCGSESGASSLVRGFESKLTSVASPSRVRILIVGALPSRVLQAVTSCSAWKGRALAEQGLQRAAGQGDGTNATFTRDQTLYEWLAQLGCGGWRACASVSWCVTTRVSTACVCAAITGCVRPFIVSSRVSGSFGFARFEAGGGAL